MKNIFLICVFLTIVRFENAVFVDPQYKLVEWTGWGTSIYRSGDALAGLSEDVQAEIYSALFSPENLNLNVIRYVIAGTSPGDKTCGAFELGDHSESFRDGPSGPYIWSRDSNARKFIQAAQRYGVDTVEAFSMSPPSWLTRNGCTNGNPDGAPLHDNFDPENANAFADYLTEVVKYYHENYNISFTSIVPFREPSLGHYKGVGNGEGCHMEKSTMNEVVKSLYAAIRTKRLEYCTISAALETNIPSELATQKYFLEANTTHLYKKVSVRGFKGNDLKVVPELHTLSDSNGHALWMSEWNANMPLLPNMTEAMNLAENIVFDLRNLLPSAWLFWEAFGQATYNFVSVPYSNATLEQIEYRAGFYVMKQFSKYIRKGYLLIHINDDDSVAAYVPATKSLIIVTLNSNSSKVDKSFDLGRFSSLGEIYALRTSKTEPHVPISVPPITGNKFDFEFPPESVTTFIIEDVTVDLRDNLIRNGDFESGKSDPWFLQYGLRDDNGVNGNYARRGGYSGSMDLTESKLELVQTVSVSQAGTYYLSAWCATTGPNTLLGILINGLQGPEITIESARGYQLYGLSVEAKPTDLLSVYFHSDMGNHTAQIDDVVMH